MTKLIRNKDGMVIRNVHTNPFYYHRRLECLLYEIEQGSITGKDIFDRVDRIVKSVQDKDLYDEYGTVDEHIECSFCVNDGTCNPVKTADQLAEALESAKAGDIVTIDDCAMIDMTDTMRVEKKGILIKSGVTLKSGRGTEGSMGGKIFTTAIIERPMIEAEENTKISGLTIQGPDDKKRNLCGMKRGAGIYSDKSKVVIENCEISGFGYAAIELVNGCDHVIKNCMIHHNRNLQAGYGIKLCNAKATMEACFFHQNTVSIYKATGDECEETKLSHDLCRDTVECEEKCEFESFMSRTKVLSRIFYGSMEKCLEFLMKWQCAFSENQDLPVENAKNAVMLALTELEQYDRYYDYIGNTCFTVNDKIYGVVPDENPLGGGYGYNKIITFGDYTVENKEEFLDALSKAKRGDTIFVKGETVIDLSDVTETIMIPDGVTIAGERGRNNSPGGLIFTDTHVAKMFEPGEDVRITGLAFKGADLERRIEHHAIAYYGPNPKGNDYYYKMTVQSGVVAYKDNLEIDNCEFAGFSLAAILIADGNNSKIHHNYIHHNQRQGLGYGVCFDRGAAVVEYNLMNANRHDIAGTGNKTSGYVARHNVQMGTSLGHCFDMHGGRDRNDGTDIAGKYTVITNNLFLSDMYPYLVRGIPEDVVEFTDNAVYYPLEHYKREYIYGAYGLPGEQERFKIHDNLFGLGTDPKVVI